MEIQPGDRVNIGGRLSHLPVEHRDDELVAVGPHGGMYRLVETDRGWRAATPPPGRSYIRVRPVTTGGSTTTGP